MTKFNTTFSPQDDKVAVATALFKEGFLLIHGAGLEDDEEEDPDDPF